MGERGNRLNRLLDRYAGIPLAACSAVARLGKKSVPAAPQRVGFICLGAIGDLLLLSALITALARAVAQRAYCPARVPRQCRHCQSDPWY